MADEPIQYENVIKVLVVNEAMQEEIAKIKAEGWDQDPSYPVTMTYVLRRPKITAPPPSGGGVGEMRIDESKVFIRSADGTIRPF
jgi:hypothetical protein